MQTRACKCHRVDSFKKFIPHAGNVCSAHHIFSRDSPSYDIKEVDNGTGFYCRVTIEGKMYLGSTRPSKKEAKQSAAEKAISLHISKSIPVTSDDMTQSKSSKDIVTI